jgi:hypothetical protein
VIVLQIPALQLAAPQTPAGSEQSSDDPHPQCWRPVLSGAAQKFEAQSPFFRQISPLPRFTAASPR